MSGAEQGAGVGVDGDLVSGTVRWEAANQPAVASALRSALRADEMSHAWLLVGPSEVGQVTLAAALAAALNCPESDDPAQGCGHCDTCGRIARGTYPALTTFTPEGQYYLVDAVRKEWLPTATRSLTEGRRKVLRVVTADRMNEATQNAFLKILEEPPPSVVWLLEADDDGMLLETVVSRCRRLNVVPWGPEALRELAASHGVASDQREALARASLGLPRRLRDLAAPEMTEARWEHLTVIDQLATGGPGRVVPLAKALVAWARSRSVPLKERHAEVMAEHDDIYGARGTRGWPPGLRARMTQRHERLERAEVRRALDILLDTLASQLRDLLVIQGGGGAERVVNVDHLDALRRDAGRLAATDVVAALRVVDATREALDGNGAPELQMERLLMVLALPLYARGVAS